MELGNVAAHIYMELESTELDLERLTEACRRLIERHDMLRAVVLPRAGSGCSRPFLRTRSSRSTCGVSQ